MPGKDPPQVLPDRKVVTLVLVGCLLCVWFLSPISNVGLLSGTAWHKQKNVSNCHSSVLRVLKILSVGNPWDMDLLSFGAPSCSGYTSRKTLKEQRKEPLRNLQKRLGITFHTGLSRGTGWHGHDILKHSGHGDHLLSLAPADQNNVPGLFHEQRLWPCPQPRQLP